MKQRYLPIAVIFLFEIGLLELITMQYYKKLFFKIKFEPSPTAALLIDFFVRLQKFPTVSLNGIPLFVVTDKKWSHPDKEKKEQFFRYSLRFFSLSRTIAAHFRMQKKM